MVLSSLEQVTFFGDLAISSGTPPFLFQFTWYKSQMRQLPQFAHTELGDGFHIYVLVPPLNAWRIHYALCFIRFVFETWNLGRCLSHPWMTHFYLTTSLLKHNPHAEHTSCHPSLVLGNLSTNLPSSSLHFPSKNSTCKCFVPAFVYHSSLLVCNTSPAVTLRSFTSWASSWGVFWGAYLEMITIHSLGGSVTTASAGSISLQCWYWWFTGFP